MPKEKNLNDIVESSLFNLLAWKHNSADEEIDITDSSVISIKIVDMQLCKKNLNLSSWFLSKRKEFCGSITSVGARFDKASNCIKF